MFRLLSRNNTPMPITTSAGRMPGTGLLPRQSSCSCMSSAYGGGARESSPNRRTPQVYRRVPRVRPLYAHHGSRDSPPRPATAKLLLHGALVFIRPPIRAEGSGGEARRVIEVAAFEVIVPGVAHRGQRHCEPIASCRATTVACRSTVESVSRRSAPRAMRILVEPGIRIAGRPADRRVLRVCVEQKNQVVRAAVRIEAPAHRIHGRTYSRPPE
jgi:hypothetical protein